MKCSEGLLDICLKQLKHMARVKTGFKQISSDSRPGSARGIRCGTSCKKCAKFRIEMWQVTNNSYISKCAALGEVESMIKFQQEIDTESISLRHL